MKKSDGNIKIQDENALHPSQSQEKKDDSINRLYSQVR